MRIEHKDNVTELHLKHTGLGVNFRKVSHSARYESIFEDKPLVRAVIEFNDLVELRNFIGALSEFENICRNDLGEFERSN